MKEPVRVLQIFSGLDSGGVSNFVMNLYREMDTDKIQFDFAITSGKREMYDDEVLARGGRIFYFDTSKSIRENVREILCEKGPFRAVHSHVFFYSGFLLAEAKKAGVPVRIAHAHNAHTGESRSILRRSYEWGMQVMIRRYATHLLGCSEKACRYVFGNTVKGDSRMEVILDGIDCERFAFNPEIREQTRKEYGLEGMFVVGHVGHFNPAKNHRKILSVFSRICSLRSDAALLLVGDGELELDVHTYSEELGIAHQVIFAGAHKDVERFYQAMDVFLFPSRYEGFGMAMIEAQTNGLCCIASDVVPEDTNVDGRTMYLPLETDDTMWAFRVMNAPGRSTEAFESIRSRFGVGQVASKMTLIYNNT